jgi:hypothetical protein
MTSYDQFRNMFRQETVCNICTKEVSSYDMMMCPFCEFESCETCVDDFFLTIKQTMPYCMNKSCKLKLWSYEFLYEKGEFDKLSKNETKLDSLISKICESNRKMKKDMKDKIKYHKSLSKN